MTKKEACYRLAEMNEEEYDLQARIDECYIDPFSSPEEKERIQQKKENYIKARDELHSEIEAFMRDYADVLYS